AAGGIAALVYQAFYQANGRYPTYTEATGLLLNGAVDLGYDPFVQGAGAANAYHATQGALDQYGLGIEPARVDAGDFRGQTFVSFPGGIVRGDTETIPFTITNPSAVAVTATLDTHHLAQVAHYSATVEVFTQGSSYYKKGSPDYALDLTPWVAAHPDADLMVVQVGVDFERFDSLPPTPPGYKNDFWLLAYNWWDDGDSVWWSDLDGDNRVDWPAELDGGDEWMRFDYSPLSATRQEVRVGRPYQRSIGAGSAGIWAGVVNYSDAAGEPVVLYYDVTFYRSQSWALVEVSPDQLTIPAGGKAHFQASIPVPADATFGIYQGTVVVTDSGRLDVDPLFTPRVVNVPLTWQVWPDAVAGATIGGSPPAGELYDNGQVGAGFDWYSYREAGDWRFYGFDLQDPPAGSVILAHTRWDHYPTDLDTIFFGPVQDEFSDAHPEWFGPHGLQKVGGSVRAGSSPKWEFQTATGGAEEWASAPAADGLHYLVQEAVLLQGSRPAEPFTTELGLAYVDPYPYRVDPDCGLSCTFTITFRSSITVPEGLTGTLGLGWTRPFTLAGSIGAVGSVTHGLIFTQEQYRLDLTLLDLAGADFLGLALYDDNGSTDGQWDPEDGLVAVLNSAIEGLGLAVHDLAAGFYWLAVAEESGTAYTIEGVSYVEASTELQFVDLPVYVGANEPVSIVVQSAAAPAEGDRALLVLGPWWLPGVVEAPVVVERIYQIFLPLLYRE
ncbi:MAG: hypothetical protein JXA42_08790, partial [Anaerolineales bacterium]|nr:hypothetical protein [Anaerolineales bacterium]